MTEEEWTQHLYDAHGKSQPTRLMDVFVLGPMMVYAGMRLQKHGDGVLGLAILLSGVGTMVYNARNYRRLRWIAEG